MYLGHRREQPLLIQGITEQLPQKQATTFGLHASQTNGIRQRSLFSSVGYMGFSETSTQHNTTHQRHSHSLYLVVTSVHVSHQRRDPPSFNTTRTDRQEVGTFIFSMIDNHRKLGRDSQPVLCLLLLLLRQLASPSSAGVRRRSRGLELWNASTAVTVEMGVTWNGKRRGPESFASAA